MALDDVAGSICESIMCGYADAERSARKCVKLDPDFAKGYGRLAEALRQGLTLVHFSSQRKHVSCDTSSA
jgi:hypothetical protein